MIESNIQGIPCLINVTHYEVVKGQGMSAPSDIDCYGYTEMEYEVCDRKGYRAGWLEKKMTTEDELRIEADVAEYMGQD